MRSSEREFISIAASLLLPVAIYAGARWLATRGGAPRQEAERVVYGLRPGMRILSLAFVTGGLCCRGLAARWASTTSWQDLIWRVPLSLLLVAWGGFILSTRMILDAEGLHYERFPNRRTLIAWNDLTHYETRSNPRSIDNVLFFRSRDPAVSIAVTDTAYDAADLLRHVLQKAHIQEKPYKSRHWFRG